MLKTVDTIGFRSPNILKEPYGSWKIWRLLTRTWGVWLLVLFLLLIVAAFGAVWVLGGIVVPIVPEIFQQYAAALGAYLIRVPAVAPLYHLIIAIACLEFLALFSLWLRARFAAHRAESLSQLARRAADIRSLLHVKYVTMGHTHETDLQSHSSGEYFNTGTWTKVFTDERERLVHEESELVFLQVVHQGDDARVRLMKWEDGPGEPRLVMLFDKDPDDRTARPRTPSRASAARVE